MNINEKLSTLKLNYLATSLPSFLEGFKDQDQALKVLTRAADLELIDKATKRTNRRLKGAKIGLFKPVEEFEWTFTSGITKAQMDELLTLNFIKEKRNIIYLGPQGIGKTHLSQNLAYRAATKGLSTFFTTASKLILDLSTQESSAGLERRLNYYERLSLLVIDELGYLNFTDKAADFIFEIVNRRYEKGSLVITTNLAFKDWSQVFPGAPCTTAMIDRLTHHADIFKLSSDTSYRRREAMQKSKGDNNAK